MSFFLKIVSTTNGLYPNYEIIDDFYQSEVVDYCIMKNCESSDEVFKLAAAQIKKIGRTLNLEIEETNLELQSLSDEEKEVFSSYEFPSLLWKDGVIAFGLMKELFEIENEDVAADIINKFATKYGEDVLERIFDENILEISENRCIIRFDTDYVAFTFFIVPHDLEEDIYELHEMAVYLF